MSYHKISLLKIMCRAIYSYVPSHYNCFPSKTQVPTSVNLVVSTALAETICVVLCIAVGSKKNLSLCKKKISETLMEMAEETQMIQ